MTHRKAVQIIKPPVTWILVADSRQAQVYTRSRVEKLIPRAGNSRRNQFEEVISHAPMPVPGMKWQAETAGKAAGIRWYEVEEAIARRDGIPVAIGKRP